MQQGRSQYDEAKEHAARRADRSERRAEPGARKERPRGLAPAAVAMLLLSLVAIAFLAAIIFRVPLVNWLAAKTLVDADVGAVSVDVSGLSLRELRFDRVALRDRRGNEFAASDVAIAYDLRTLMRTRRVGAIEAGEASITIVEWPPALGGAERSGSGGGLAGAPFERLSVPKISLTATSPIGDFTGEGGVDLSFADGGEARFDLNAAALSIGGGEKPAAYAGATGFSMRLKLAADGSFAAEATLQSAQIAAWRASVPETGLTFRIEGVSWRRAMENGVGDLEATATVAIEPTSISLAADGAPDSTEPGWSEALAIEILRGGVGVSGQVAASLAAGELIVHAPLGALAFEAPSASVGLTLGQLAEEPLLRVGSAGLELAARLQAAGKAPGSLELRSRARNSRDLEFAIDAALLPGEVGQVAWGEATASIDGRVAGDIAEADVAFVGALARAAIGRLVFADAELEARGRIEADRKSKRATFALLGGCIELGRGAFKVPTQAMSTQLVDAELCETAAPLLSASWAGSPRVSAAGRLDARRGRFALASTNVDGSPPTVEFEAAYSPTEHLSRIEARLSGGDAILNGALGFAGVTGAATGRLGDDGLSG